jgi:hypothetical protein
VALLLNEALTFEQVMRGLAWSFSAVMRSIYAMAV